MPPVFFLAIRQIPHKTAAARQSASGGLEAIEKEAPFPKPARCLSPCFGDRSASLPPTNKSCGLKGTHPPSEAGRRTAHRRDVSCYVEKSQVGRRFGLAYSTAAFGCDFPYVCVAQPPSAVVSGRAHSSKLPVNESAGSSPRSFQHSRCVPFSSRQGLLAKRAVTTSSFVRLMWGKGLSCRDYCPCDRGI